MDLMGLAALRKHVDWGLIRFLLPAGLLGTVAGALSFRLLDVRLIAGIVGIATLLLLAQRLLLPPRADSPSAPRWLGAMLTVTSGFTSFVAHVGGPPIHAYVLPMRLPPLVFSGTMAVFFFTLNLSKWIPYGWLGLLDVRNMATSVALMPFAPIGVLFGIKMAHRVRSELFYRLAYGGMLLTGCKLLWDGFIA
jgi:uncharacterized membrane protein YfcA